MGLKSAGGARHAGNLILLCKLHHDNFGRRLTRAVVTAALQGAKKRTQIRFAESADGVSEVIGEVIELIIPDTGEIVELFFTIDHAAYWLSHTAAGLRSLLKWFWTEAWTEQNFCNVFMLRNRSIAHSRRRHG